ncbi:MAG: DivIVA domain-containing protein [Eubacterium sp.]|nr:DivIVA domain-containing protein [Eubacterium sp.]
MITPSQIRERKISTVDEGGYDRAEVNELLVEILDSYEAIFDENKELYRKMDILANRIEEYRADEDSIKKTLITAQKMADKVTSDANLQAEKTISESRESAQNTVNDAQEKADKIVGEARDYVAELTREKTAAANEIIAEAEKKANEAIDGAKLVAQNALVQAKNLANKIVSDSKKESDFYSSMVDKLKSEAMQFRVSLVTLYEAQLSKLGDIENNSANTAEEEQSIEAIESELNNILENIDEIVSNAPEKVQEPEMEQEEVAEPEEIDEIEEIEEIDEVEESEEPEEDAQVQLDEDEVVDEIIEELDELHSHDEPPTPEEIQDAINSFSANEITPISDDAVNPIPVIEDEPEFESPLPFESYFDTKKGHEHTDETISLIPPEEDEDDDEDFSKFKGFFKKRK